MLVVAAGERASGWFPQGPTKRGGDASKTVPIVCICGPSAAGKTTFAADLAGRLRLSGRLPLVIACDNYYRSGWTPVSRYGFDTVDAIDADQLRLQLSALRYRQLDALRSYDMRTRKVGLTCLSQPYDLILVEGSYGPQLLFDAVPLSLVVYIDAPLVQRLIRRLWRDVRDRHRPAVYVIRQMLREMLPGEGRFIAPLKCKADVIVRDVEPGLATVLERVA